MVHLEAVVLGPVPVEGVRLPLGVPAPLYAKPKVMDTLCEVKIIGLQPMTGRQKALHQECGFHKVSAVVELREMEGLTSFCVVPVGPGAVEALQFFKRGDYLLNAGNALFTGKVSALCPGYYGHYAKAGAAGCDNGVIVIAALTGHTR